MASIYSKNQWDINKPDWIIWGNLICFALFFAFCLFLGFFQLKFCLLCFVLICFVFIQFFFHYSLEFFILILCFRFCFLFFALFILFQFLFSFLFFVFDFFIVGFSFGLFTRNCTTLVHCVQFVCIQTTGGIYIYYFNYYIQVIFNSHNTDHILV